ncbi:phthiocerol/phthiodiolone dimycocerosyl transferase family protein [Longimycelium tulufanense]|uniref:phthiocerol/phthiodiolone dimycocerosyl transferase family protein n=1 Tax=Longimycelium tulufanense TaxID=907463 RepID=UPI00166D5A32|nr:hypothetical protein [Longimycelium tulufanense]
MLERALTMLTSKHALLRTRIVRDRRRYLVRVIDDFTPELVVRHNDTDPFLTLANEPWRAERSVFRAVLSLDNRINGHVQGPGGTLLLAIDHAVTDGRSKQAMLEELWDHYTTLASGGDLRPRRSNDLGNPTETRLAGRFSAQDLATFTADFEDRLARVEPAALPTAAAPDLNQTPTFGLIPIPLDRDQTTSLVATARASGFSVHAMLSGAILVAFRKHLTPSTGRLHLAELVPIDLRPRLTPPLAANTLTQCVSMITVGGAVTEQDDPLTVGRMIAGELNHAIESDEILKMVLLPRSWPLFFMFKRTNVATVLVSNLGVVPKPVTPSAVHITSVRNFALPRGPLPAIFVRTMDGRLSGDLVYNHAYFTDDQMTQLANDIEANLTSVSPDGLADAMASTTG